MGPCGPAAILDAILNNWKCPTLIFTPSQRQKITPGTLIRMDQTKNSLTDEKGFPKNHLTPWLYEKPNYLILRKISFIDF